MRYEFGKPGNWNYWWIEPKEIMTPKSTAEKLARHTAMQCTGSIIDDTQAILTTIPLVEYEELRLACEKNGHNNHDVPCGICQAMDKLSAKLNEKGQP